MLWVCDTTTRSSVWTKPLACSTLEHRPAFAGGRGLILRSAVLPKPGQANLSKKRTIFVLTVESMVPQRHILIIPAYIGWSAHTAELLVEDRQKKPTSGAQDY